MTDQLPVDVVVNGAPRSATVEPRRTLAELLREELGLTGTHLGCEHGVCGACTVLLDGEPVRSCLVLAVQVGGREVTTIEGLAHDTGQGVDGMHPVQRGFLESISFQCGFCTPGFVVATKAFLDKHPKATAEDIRRGMSGNLCRCGTYHGIQKVIAQFTQKGA